MYFKIIVLFYFMTILSSCNEQSDSQVLTITQLPSDLTQTALNPFMDGFYMQINNIPCPDSDPNCFLNLSLIDDLGHSKDIEKDPRTGKTIYVFPREIPARSYDAIERNILEYKKVVGSVLSRPPKNLSEFLWSYGRRTRWRRIWRHRAPDIQSFCENGVREILSYRALRGEQPLQYGNCGEGGFLGACLSVKAGFNPYSEIRHCRSENDHVFAMVKKEENNWCVIDRWSVARGTNRTSRGHFTCEMDWDKENNVITERGIPSRASWFKKVTCYPFAAFVQAP